MEPEIYPLLIPHVEPEEGQLLLGGSRICELSREEFIFCRLCDGKHSMNEILRMLPELSPPEDVLPYLLNLSWPLGPAEATKDEGSRILVIAPHPDSAFTAMGGTISGMKHDKAEVLVCFRQLANTLLPDVFESVAEISAIRGDEAHWAAAICGVDISYLDFPAFDLRKEAPGFGPENELKVASAIQTALWAHIHAFQPQRIYAPAGIGRHPDHMMVHSIVLDTFKRNWFPDTEFWLYREYPWSLSYHQVDETRSRIEDSYVKLTEQYIDVTSEAPHQELLMDLFFSLFDPGELSLWEHVRERIKLESGHPGKSVQEAFFKLSPFHS